MQTGIGSPGFNHSLAQAESHETGHGISTPTREVIAPRVDMGTGHMQYHSHSALRFSYLEEFHSYDRLWTLAIQAGSPPAVELRSQVTVSLI